MTKTILPATDIRASYELMEDYLQISIPPVAENADDCFISIEREKDKQKQTELFALSPDNKILHFYYDKNSPSGWTHSEVVVPNAPKAKIKKLLSFCQADALFLLVQYNHDADTEDWPLLTMVQDKGTWYRITDPWNDPNAKPDPNASEGKWLTSQFEDTKLYCDPQGNNYFYGKTIIDRRALDGHGVETSNGLFAFKMEIAANIQQSYFKISKIYSGDIQLGATGSVLCLAGGSDAAKESLVTCMAKDNWQNILYLKTSNSLENWNIKPITELKMKLSDLKFKVSGLNYEELNQYQLFALPDTTNASFLMLSKLKELVYVADPWNKKTISLLTGQDKQPPGVSKVSLSKNVSGQILIYAMDSENNFLWLLRQNNNDPNNPTFGDWIKLGDPVLSFTAPEQTEAAAELFIVFSDPDDQQIKIKHLKQDAETTIWHTDILATSTTKSDPEEHKVYALELTTVDKNGRPVAEVALAISTNRKSIIYANGFAYHTSAQQKAVCITDSRGTVTIKTKAVSLSAPEIRVHCGEFMKDNEIRSFRSDTHAHERLAGKDPDFEVSEAALQNKAKIIPAKVDDKKQKLAKQLPDALKHIGNAMLKKNQQPSNTKLNFTADEQGGFEFDFTNPDAPVINVLNSSEALAKIAEFKQHELEGFFSHLFGDIVHACKHFVHDIEKIAVVVVEDAIHLAIHAFNDIKHIVVKSMDELGAMLESLLHKVEHLFKLALNAIKELIHWLAALFNWDDILRTKEVYKYYINAMLTGLEGELGKQAVTSIKDNFDKIKSIVNNSFNQAESFFEGKNLNSMTTDDTKKKKTDMDNLSQRHSVRSNYILHHKQAASDTVSLTNASLMSAEKKSDALNDLMNFIEKNIKDDQYKKSLKKIETWFSNIKDPENFLEDALLSFIEAIKDLVIFSLDIMEELLEIFLKLIAEMIKLLQELINKKIEHPHFLCWLYKKISGGDDLTLLDLTSLILALPTTILYKVSHHNQAPVTKDNLRQLTPKTITWPFQSMNKLAAVSEENDKITLKLMCGLSYLTYGVTEFCLVKPENIDKQIENSLMLFIAALGMQGFSIEGVPARSDIDNWSTTNTLANIQWVAYFFPLILGTYISCKNIMDPDDVNFDSNFTNFLTGTFIFILGMILTMEDTKKPEKDRSFKPEDYVEAMIVPLDIIVADIANLSEEEFKALQYGSALLCNFTGGVCHVVSGRVR